MYVDVVTQSCWKHRLFITQFKKISTNAGQWTYWHLHSIIYETIILLVHSYSCDRIQVHIRWETDKWTKKTSKQRPRLEQNQISLVVQVTHIECVIKIVRPFPCVQLFSLLSHIFIFFSFFILTSSSLPSEIWFNTVHLLNQS